MTDASARARATGASVSKYAVNRRDMRAAVVLQAGEQRFCLVVDRVRGREEVVIKALPRALRGLPGYACASLIGDGRMALILDVDALLSTGLRTQRRLAEVA